MKPYFNLLLTKFVICDFRLLKKKDKKDWKSKTRIDILRIDIVTDTHQNTFSNNDPPKHKIMGQGYI